jgi:hypothetical protein
MKRQLVCKVHSRPTALCTNAADRAMMRDTDGRDHLQVQIANATGALESYEIPEDSSMSDHAASESYSSRANTRVTCSPVSGG